MTNGIHASPFGIQAKKCLTEFLNFFWCTAHEQKKLLSDWDWDLGLGTWDLGNRKRESQSKEMTV